MGPETYWRWRQPVFLFRIKMSFGFQTLFGFIHSEERRNVQHVSGRVGGFQGNVEKLRRFHSLIQTTTERLFFICEWFYVLKRKTRQNNVTFHLPHKWKILSKVGNSIKHATNTWIPVNTCPVNYKNYTRLYKIKFMSSAECAFTGRGWFFLLPQRLSGLRTLQRLWTRVAVDQPQLLMFQCGCPAPRLRGDAAHHA